MDGSFFILLQGWSISLQKNFEIFARLFQVSFVPRYSVLFCAPQCLNPKSKNITGNTFVKSNHKWTKEISWWGEKKHIQYAELKCI